MGLFSLSKKVRKYSRKRRLERERKKKGSRR